MELKNILTEKEIKRINEMKGRIVQHFKGDLYYVKGIGESSEGTIEVYYMALYENCKLHNREIKDFLSNIENRKDNKTGQKYKFEIKEIESVNKKGD